MIYECKSLNLDLVQSKRVCSQAVGNLEPSDQDRTVQISSAVFDFLLYIKFEFKIWTV